MSLHPFYEDLPQYEPSDLSLLYRVWVSRIKGYPGNESYSALVWAIHQVSTLHSTWLQDKPSEDHHVFSAGVEMADALSKHEFERFKKQSYSQTSEVES